MEPRGVIATAYAGLLLACLLAGCALPQRTESTLRVIVLRHAEKHTRIAQDPPLTEAGQARAQAIARRLSGQRLQAIYATDTRRARDTASPTAHANGVSLTIYDGKQPAAAFVDGLRRSHPRGTLLVVGHSNTVPGIVAALCACEVAAMDESEYTRWSEVRFDAGGHARLIQDRY